MDGSSSSAGRRPGRVIVEVDARDPARLAVLRTQAIEGTIEDARLTGRTARIVVSSIPDALFGETAQRRHARGWLPETAFRSRRSGRRTSGKAVACRAVRRPAAFSGTGVLTVLTVDLARGLPAVDADAVFTSGETVYASATSLYVATQRWESEARTSLHRFDTSNPDSTGYAGSANVPGTLLNQFSLSEHDGVLRAATTLGDESESVVTTLAVRPDGLAARGQVRGLGRGERIYAVRFMGPTGYVVTFRQVDPLYTLDLSDPDRPRAVGELKIPGYSAYLHPVAEGLLLGVGQDATSAGRVQGLQLSLFDVSNPASPRRLHQLKLAGNGRARPWNGITMRSSGGPTLASPCCPSTRRRSTARRASGSTRPRASRPRAASSTARTPRSSARSSCAACSTPCRRSASARRRSTRSPTWAGPRSRIRPSRRGRSRCPDARPLGSRPRAAEADGLEPGCLRGGWNGWESGLPRRRGARVAKHDPDRGGDRDRDGGKQRRAEYQRESECGHDRVPHERGNRRRLLSGLAAITIGTGHGQQPTDGGAPRHPS